MAIILYIHSTHTHICTSIDDFILLFVFIFQCFITMHFGFKFDTTKQKTPLPLCCYSFHNLIFSLFCRVNIYKYSGSPGYTSLAHRCNGLLLMLSTCIFCLMENNNRTCWVIQYHIVYYNIAHSTNTHHFNNNIEN